MSLQCLQSPVSPANAHDPLLECPRGRVGQANRLVEVLICPGWPSDDDAAPSPLEAQVRCLALNFTR